MKPYFQDKAVTIYHGDCREITAVLDKPQIIVCDPPYGRGVALNIAGAKIANDTTTEVRDWIIGVGEGAPMMIFGSPRIARPAGDFFPLIWDKSELTGMGDLQWPWKLTHEEIYVFGTGFSSPRRQGSVLHVPLRPAWTNHPDAISGKHPNEKPLSLMHILIESCPSGFIFDPCCGIGTTLLASKNLGRAAIGIELDEKYCEIAAKRMGQEVFDFSSK